MDCKTRLYLLRRHGPDLWCSGRMDSWKYFLLCFVLHIWYVPTTPPPSTTCQANSRQEHSGSSSAPPKCPSTPLAPTTHPQAILSKACKHQSSTPQLVRSSHPTPHNTCSKDSPPHPGLYYVTLAVLTFIYLICSIRTNICLFLALFLLVITFSLFAAVYFQTAEGNLLQAEKLQTVPVPGPDYTLPSPVLVLNADGFVIGCRRV
jgi:GPR1/FUN34/yaaH family